MKRRKYAWKINLKLFFGLLATLLLVSFVSKTIQVAKSSIFDGRSRITIVATSKEKNRDRVLLFSFEPGQESITLLIIPQNTLVQTSYGFGNYELGSVYNLGQISKVKGGEILRKTMQDFVGTFVEGWMVVEGKLENKDWKIDDRETKSLVKDSFSLKETILFIKNGGLTNLETNLTYFDIVRLWYQAKGVRLDKIEILELEELDVLKKTQLLDGKEVYEADLRHLDKISSGLFSSPIILAEKKTIEIVNGTDVPGLATTVARILGNAGGQVLFVKTAQEKIEKSSIIAHLGGSFTLRKISKMLNIQVAKQKEGEGGQNLTDILILIGEDYLK